MNSRYLVLFVSLQFFTIFSSIAQTHISNSKDTIEGKQLNEVVVLATKLKQILLHSPITLHKLNTAYFKQNASPTFFDALENVQGVQMITPSLGFKIINTRGFANTTNVRFSQLVDGMDVQSPHIGAPIGNALGPSDLDIKNVEIIPGVASTLFGMNSINGLANFETYTPFEKEGLSVQQKTGVNHIKNTSSTAKLFLETSLRFSKVINTHFAYKINLSFSKGYDWIADNKTELNPDANASTNLSGYENPAQDQVNVYGNESSNRKTIQLQGKSYVVARTGYAEQNVANYNLQNFKGDLSLYYKFKNNSILSYTQHFAQLNDVYQRSNRFVLNNYLVQQHALQYQSNSVNIKLYTNNENSGDSYNLRSMAENLDRSFKPDAVWYPDYTVAFNKAYLTGASVSMAHQLARTSADAGRYQPSTYAFNTVKSKLQQINNWDSGAALKVIARLVHAEIQFDLVNLINKKMKDKGLDAILGLDSRTYLITPDGNYFENTIKGKANEDIVYSKIGSYLSLNQTLNKFRIGLAYRVDKNDYFKMTSNPRATILYVPNKNNSIRISYSEGFRFPSIFEAYSNINSGGVKRIGGLPIMSSGVYENAWLATSMSLFQSAVLNDVNKNGFTQTQAIIKNNVLLQRNTYGYIKPEQIKSFEFGYRSSLLQDRLSLDIDFYYNNYNNFIAQTNVNVPKTSDPDSIPFALNDKTKYSQYRIWTNSKSIVYNYGFSLGMGYVINNDLKIGINATYSQLQKTTNDDALEDGYNTPNWIVNASISKKNLFKNFGVGIAYKWQSAYYTQTFLVTGTTKSYGVLDASIAKWLPKYKLTIKAGGSNLSNNYYYTYLGGPGVGGLYYISLTYQ